MDSMSPAGHPLATIIQNARLNIIDYEVEKRRSLEQTRRILDFYSVSYMKSGSSRLHIFGRDYYAKTGDVLIIPPGVLHDHVKDTDEESIFMWWNFSYRLYGVVDILCMHQLPLLFHLENREPFESAFDAYQQRVTRLNTISDYIYKEAKAYELIAILLESVFSKQNDALMREHPDRFVEILAEIMRHPERCNLLPLLAEKFHMHPTYISNQFKRLYNITPAQFQRQIRLQKAVDILTSDHSRSIGEIAGDLGYEQSSDFTRFFKSHYGVSPQQYRTMHLFGRQTT